MTRLANDAARAFDLVQSDAIAASRLATAILADAHLVGDPAAAGIAERTLGVAAAAGQSMSAAIEHLGRAVEHGLAAGDSQLVLGARTSLAGALVQYGDASGALREIDLVLAGSTGLDHARALTQRGTMYQHMSRLDEALRDYTQAEPGLAEDEIWLQRLLMNRGLLLLSRHQYDAAGEDLRRARDICDRRGLTLAGAFVYENLGTLAARLGDVPEALQHLATAERLCRQVGSSVASLQYERAELLLAANLLDEARAAATVAVDENERLQRPLYASEARLLLARTAVASDPAFARVQAEQATEEFESQGRSGWAVLARATVAHTSLSRPDVTRPGQATPYVTSPDVASPDVTSPEQPTGTSLDTSAQVRDVRRLATLAEDVDRAGWDLAATDLRLAVATRAVTEPGTRALGLELLDAVAPMRHRGPTSHRVRGWLAAALAEQARGRPGPASQAAAAGLQVLDAHRATLVATDLRARVSELGVSLATVGLRAAVQAGSALRVLDWSERGRARHLVDRPVTDVHGPRLPELLARLRTVVAELDDARGLGVDISRLRRQQGLLEAQIRDEVRLRAATGPANRTEHPPVELLHDALRTAGDAALVEYADVDDVLFAIVLTGGRTALVPLGPLERVRTTLHWVPFALRRLAPVGPSAAAQAAAAGLLRSSTQVIDDHVVAPLRPLIGDRPLVVVPTGPLAATPWALLPSLAGQPVTVSPTAGMWHSATTSEGTACDAGEVLVAAGPGLPGAAREAAEVATRYGATPLTGQAATVAAVLTGLGRSRLAHLAAHGAIRSDNPLFSSLRFADGPLTLYDLDDLACCPSTVTMSACEGANSVVLAGDEMLGFAAAFLGRGTRHVLGSIGPLPDAETEPLMVQLHARLAAGDAPAAALVQVQSSIDPTDVRSWAAAGSFVCIGGGHRPL